MRKEWRIKTVAKKNRSDALANYKSDLTEDSKRVNCIDLESVVCIFDITYDEIIVIIDIKSC